MFCRGGARDFKMTIVLDESPGDARFHSCRASAEKRRKSCFPERLPLCLINHFGSGLMKPNQRCRVELRLSPELANVLLEFTSCLQNLHNTGSSAGLD